ncbi:MAG: hypothetical protein V4642_11950, partial [Bacteroidota bacterium]
MDIQQYISSGILELYAAGALSPEEMRAVERVMADYPEVRRELSDIEDALEQFAMLNAKPPRENVKANLLQQIGGNEQIEKPGVLLKEPEVLKEKSQATILPLPNQAVAKSRVPFYLAAASFAGLVIASSSAMYFYSQWKSVEYELLAINNDKNRTEQEYSLMQASLKNMNYDLGIIVHKNTKAIPITAVKQGMNDGAVVYWNSVTKDVYLKFDKLPPPPVLTPAEEMKTFKLPPGFKAELVASEPMIDSPIALSF